MSAWTVQESDKLGNEPRVVREVQRMVGMMIDDGTLEGSSVAVGPGDPVLWVENDRRVIIGVMVYSVIEHAGYLWVNLAYVAKGHRRQGVFRALTTRVEEIAKAKKLDNVSRGVLSSNLQMHDVLTRLGYTANSIVYEKKVRP